MATHSSVLAWKISWREEIGGLWSIGSQRVRHDLETKKTSHPANHQFVQIQYSGGLLLTLLLYHPFSSSSIGSIRRSVSCPRSISSQSPSCADIRPFSAQQVISASRPTSGSRSHSLNRASSYTRHLPQSNDASSSDSLMVSLLFCCPEMSTVLRNQVAEGLAGRRTD